MAINRRNTHTTAYFSYFLFQNNNYLIILEKRAAKYFLCQFSSGSRWSCFFTDPFSLGKIVEQFSCWFLHSCLFRIVLILDWLPPRLLYYLTYSLETKIFILSFPRDICVKVNVAEWNVNSDRRSIFHADNTYSSHPHPKSNDTADRSILSIKNELLCKVKGRCILVLKDLEKCWLKRAWKFFLWKKNKKQNQLK